MNGRVAGSGAGDAITGCAVALIASSNLVQGMWADQLPWLNLTLLSVAVVVPAMFMTTMQRLPLATFVSILLLVSSVVLGFVEPGIGATAGSKRITLVFAVVFILVASMITLTNRKRVEAFFSTLVILALLVVLGQVLIPDPLALLIGRRTPQGTNPIGTGRIIGAGLIILAAAWANPAWRNRRIALLLVAAPLAYGLFAAGSRGPIAGVVLGLIILVWTRPGVSAVTRLATTVGTLALCWVGYQLLSSNGSRLAGASDSGRWQLYEDAAQVAMAHPWGVGWGNFYRFAPSSAVANQQGEQLYAHNIILEFWLEAGVLGAMLFTIFLALVFRAALIKLASPERASLLALAASLFVGAMFSSDIVGNRLMWSAFGTIIAVSQDAPRGGWERVQARIHPVMTASTQSRAVRAR